MTVKLRWVLAGGGIVTVAGGLAWAVHIGLGLAAAGAMIYLLAAFS